MATESKETGEVPQNMLDVVGSITSVDVVEILPGAALRIVSTSSESDKKSSVERRYEDFESLHKSLVSSGVAAKIPGLELPKLPMWGAFWADEQERRRGHLDNYLKRLISVKEGNEHVSLRVFLTETERADWPSQVGDIDLVVHDLPHKSSMTEWWYFNFHFEDSKGRKYSAYVAFLCRAKSQDNKGYKNMACALHWAFTDVSTGKYYQESLLDREMPALVASVIEDDEVMDPLLKRAYLDVTKVHKNVPEPDRLFEKDPTLARDKLDVDMQNATVVKNADGTYHITARAPDHKDASKTDRASIDFTLKLEKKPVRHGMNGVVKGHDGDDMFYYFCPRASVTGTFTVEGEERTIAKGSGWYDHEFGGYTSLKDDEGNKREQNIDSYAWNWAAVQLSNGWEVSAAVLADVRDIDNPKEMERRWVLIDPKGDRHQVEGTFEPAIEDEDRDVYVSLKTFSPFPLRWKLVVPSLDLDVILTTPVPNQEFVTVIQSPSYWEGRIEAEGSMGGRAVTGLGYIERNGWSKNKSLSRFFKAVGAEVRKQVRGIYPDVIDRDAAILLIADKEREHYIEGVPFEILKENLGDPIRVIADRGGKSWRSYAAVACIDAVGGDSTPLRNWLAMPELMHVGSLIVDDIQDDSKTRRGGPCSHLLYGNALAINSGTSAYFQGIAAVDQSLFTDKQMNDIFNDYFLALRAGHAGQALDIAGLDYVINECIETGNAALAQERVLAIHRLKTAVPAGTLARMGAIAGGASKTVKEAMGLYFESVGVAFQIMDDVLNLRGLYTTSADKKAGTQLKTTGEDIMAGKVTIPVAKAIGLLPKDEMKELWTLIQSKPQDRPKVDWAIDVLEKCGAIEECAQEAHNLVEKAWADLDKVIPDSLPKIYLRAFGWFVTERHL